MQTISPNCGKIGKTNWDNKLKDKTTYCNLQISTKLHPNYQIDCKEAWTLRLANLRSGF